MGPVNHDAQACDAVTQVEIESLYKRFRTLDRGRKGYISGDEFLSIPELSINPIAQRIVRVFESVNFKDFIRLLAPFSGKAPRDLKLKGMFTVFDIDEDGLVGREDLAVMLRQLTGSHLSEEELHELVNKAMEEAGSVTLSKGGLDFTAFKQALDGVDLSNMVVEVPVEW